VSSKLPKGPPTATYAYGDIVARDDEVEMDRKRGFTCRIFTRHVKFAGVSVPVYCYAAWGKKVEPAHPNQLTLEALDSHF